MKKLITLLVVATILFGTTMSDLSSGPLKPPLGYSGAPDEGNCTSCHSGTPVNEGGGTMSVSFNGADNEYVPGKTYKITVKVTDLAQSPVCGFEAVILDPDLISVGKPNIITPENTIIRKWNVNNRTYISNYEAAAYQKWTFKWKAPSSNVGDITIYAAGNASNNSSSPVGDHIYTTSLTLTPGGPEKMSGMENTPFRIYPTTIHQQVTAEFSLDEASHAEFLLYDLHGQVEEILMQTELEAGNYQRVFALNQQHEPGIYLLVMKTAEGNQTQKVVIQ